MLALQFNERNTLKSLSQRRVLHVLGAPHPEASPAAEQVDLGRYAAGSSRSVHDVRPRFKSPPSRAPLGCETLAWGAPKGMRGDSSGRHVLGRRRE